MLTLLARAPPYHCFTPGTLLLHLILGRLGIEERTVLVQVRMVKSQL